MQPQLTEKKAAPLDCKDAAIVIKKWDELPNFYFFGRDSGGTNPFTR